MAETAATPATTAAPTPDTNEEGAPKTIDAGKWANRRVYHRLVIYTAGGHLFAGFIILLFELGSRNK
ncbi:DUF6126 family protein [Kitasatospora sp. NPDC056184]|uniref:DUF6126 family protein n=1 Tax=Kitasatospora sp. NPDC056184 TaxID=3345738 RepID=UPI0035DDAD31